MGQIQKSPVTKMVEGEYVEVTSTEELIKVLREETGVPLNNLDNLLQYLKNTKKAFFVLTKSRVWKRD